MNLRKIIDTERRNQYVSQSELARKSGHSVSTIHEILSGKDKNPGYRIIVDICEVLHLSLDELDRRRRSSEGSND